MQMFYAFCVATPTLCNPSRLRNEEAKAIGRAGARVGVAASCVRCALLAALCSLCF